MNYTVTSWNNLCRVFELPDNYPSYYCFGGGVSVTFQMVDWFRPVDLPETCLTKEECVSRGVNPDKYERNVDDEKLKKQLTAFLLQKNYVKNNKKYLVLTDFGMAFVFYKQ